MMSLLFVVCFFLLLPDVLSSKFLVYNPCFGPSQVLFMGQLADILAEGGHEVVNYVPTVNSECNITGSRTARVLKHERKFESDFRVTDMQSTAWQIDHRSALQFAQLFAGLGEEFRLSCEDQLKDEKLIEQLRAENFDLGLSEYFDICGFALFHKAGIKRHILVYSSPMSMVDAELFGIPATPSFVPSLLANWQTERMSIGQRMENLFHHYVFKFYAFDALEGRTAAAFPPDMPDFRSVLGRSSYVFVNIDEHLEFGRPISSKIVYIGGLGMRRAQKEAKELSPELKAAVDNSKRGFVVVSFGTIASSYAMPNATKEAWVAAFRRFPDVLFVWKYEKPGDGQIGYLPNVFLQSWIPQTKLLSHPRCLAFVTHGGLNSVTQGTYAGVPMLSVPLFADQTRNAAMLESRGIGIRLNKFELTADVIADGLRKILDDPKYKTRARELSALIRAKPMGPDERILRYAEFAAQHNVHSFLDMYGRELNWFSYNNLDILALLLAAFVLIVYALRRSYSYFFSRPQATDIQKKLE